MWCLPSSSIIVTTATLAENVTRSRSVLKTAVNISSNSTLSSFTIVIFTHCRSLPDVNASSVEEGVDEKSAPPKTKENQQLLIYHRKTSLSADPSSSSILTVTTLPRLSEEIIQTLVDKVFSVALYIVFSNPITTSSF